MHIPRSHAGAAATTIRVWPSMLLRSKIRVYMEKTLLSQTHICRSSTLERASLARHPWSGTKTRTLISISELRTWQCEAGGVGQGQWLGGWLPQGVHCSVEFSSENFWNNNHGMLYYKVQVKLPGSSCTPWRHSWGKSMSSGMLVWLLEACCWRWECSLNAFLTLTREILESYRFWNEDQLCGLLTYCKIHASY